MGLKILHSADWHLDSPFASFPEAQRQFLRRWLRRVPGRILEVARQEKPDLVLLSGDLFDGRGTGESIALVKQTLAQLGLPVFISPGNHDHCGPDSPWEREIWPENVHIFTGALTGVALPELNCRVYGAGYQSMDCPPLLENFRAEGQERYCVGVLHADPLIRNSPCCPVLSAQIRESGLDYLALGHIHRPGSLREGSTLCAWPGCPMGRGWDETEKGGVYLVTLEDTADARFIELDFPRFYDWEVQAVPSPEAALEAALPGSESHDFYRITLTGTGEADLQVLTRRFAHIPHLTLRSSLLPPISPWEGIEEDSLRGVYLRLLQESEHPLAEKAARLSQQLLSGREVMLP